MCCFRHPVPKFHDARKRQSQDRATYNCQDGVTPDINHPKLNWCKTQRDGYPKLGRFSTLLLWHHFAGIWSGFIEWGDDKQDSRNSINIWKHPHCHGLVMFFSLQEKNPWHLVLEHDTVSGAALCKVVAKSETWWCALTPVSLEDGTAWRIFLKYIHKAWHKEEFAWNICPVLLYWRIKKKI